MYSRSVRFNSYVITFLVSVVALIASGVHSHSLKQNLDASIFADGYSNALLASLLTCGIWVLLGWMLLNVSRRNYEWGMRVVGRGIYCICALIGFTCLSGFGVFGSLVVLALFIVAGYILVKFWN